MSAEIKNARSVSESRLELRKQQAAALCRARPCRHRLIVIALLLITSFTSIHLPLTDTFPLTASVGD